MAYRTTALTLAYDDAWAALFFEIIDALDGDLLHYIGSATKLQSAHDAGRAARGRPPPFAAERGANGRACAADIAFFHVPRKATRRRAMPPSHRRCHAAAAQLSLVGRH